MYSPDQIGKALLCHAAKTVLSSLYDIAEALPWLELGLFATLVLGLTLG